MLCNWIQDCNSVRGRADIKTMKSYIDIGWKELIQIELKSDARIIVRPTVLEKQKLLPKQKCYQKHLLLLENDITFFLGLCNGSILLSAQEDISKVTCSVLSYYLQTITKKKKILLVP